MDADRSHRELLSKGNGDVFHCNLNYYHVEEQIFVYT